MSHLITLADTSFKRDQAIAYIQDIYARVYETIPGESDVYFISHKDETMTGVIALDFADSKDKMPMESVYEIDLSEISFPVTSHNSVQFGRWIAEDPRVSVCLSYIATVYSLKLGKEYIWLTQTFKTHRVLRQKGIIFYPLTRAKLVYENIPPGDLAYYLSENCPKCYISVARQQKAALQKKSDEIKESGYVLFDKNIF
ncbi:MAG: hypothetical protein V4665_03530 [Patescibacteria group bacterium]